MLKKTIKLSILLLFLFFGQTAKVVAQQEISVEKSFFEIQTGLAGVWFISEMKIFNSIALRTEAGLEVGVSSTFFPAKDYYVMVPSIILEPRYYFNLKTRAARSHKIRKNSGTFISLQTKFNPDWFFIPHNDVIKQIKRLYIIPTFGARYATIKHFTFEAGFGYGYLRKFPKKEYFGKNEKNSSSFNIHLRFGYWF